MGMEILPLTHSIYSLILSNAISKQNCRSSCCSHVILLGSLGNGWERIVYTSIFKKRNSTGRLARGGWIVPNTELSGPLEQRTRILQEKLGTSSSYSLCRDQNIRIRTARQSPFSSPTLQVRYKLIFLSGYLDIPFWCTIILQLEMSPGPV